MEPSSNGGPKFSAGERWTEETVDLYHLWDIVVRRRQWVVALGVIGLVLALAYTIAQPPDFRARATLLLQPRDPVSHLMDARTPAMDPRLPTYARLLTTREVLRKALPEIYSRNVHDTALVLSGIQSKLSTKIWKETSLVELTYRGHNRRYAKRVVTGIINVFPDYLREQREEILQAALEAAKRSTEETDSGRGRVSRRVQELRAALQLSEARKQGFTARVVNRPAVRQVGPSFVLNASLGAFLGFILGLCMAFGIEFLDPRVRTERDLRRVVDVPLLGEIPGLESEDPGDFPDIRDNGHNLFTESVRLLRTNLFFGRESSPRTVLITSPLDRAGKTTVSRNLARSITLMEEHPLLVDVDLRRGRLHRFVEQPRRPGLTDVLRGDVTLDDALHTGDDMSVLTVGSRADNPPELLGSPAMTTLLEEGRNRFDRVILDGTPLIGLADMMRLAGRVDALLVVVRYEQTPADGIQDAVDQLREAGHSPTGIVLNMVARDDSKYYRYYENGDEDGEFVHQNGSPTKPAPERTG